MVSPLIQQSVLDESEALLIDVNGGIGAYEEFVQSLHLVMGSDLLDKRQQLVESLGLFLGGVVVSTWR